eukprot:TRINITY_DN2357_c0_g1_i1.p1 TRINITY_DN2357_c0_g1~~TRINITY_DN2357_c0_g1_i1.p1  ORF type:complete len:511 (-),score=120.25 TRINITY_DN2357_c0_g1_i1:53-1528(-)
MSLLYRPFVFSSRSLLLKPSSQLFIPHQFYRISPQILSNFKSSAPKYFLSAPHQQFSTSSPPQSPAPKTPPTPSPKSAPSTTPATNAPLNEQLTPEQIRLAKAMEEKRIQAKLAQAKKIEKKKKREQDKEKAKAQKKSKKELEMIAQVERIRKGRVKTIRKFLKPENLRPPSYDWDQEKVFNYFLSHPTLSLATDENKNVVFVPGQPLSHPSRLLQSQTRGTRFIKLNNTMFLTSSYAELIGVRAAKHRVFSRLGFEITLPIVKNPARTSAATPTPAPTTLQGHKSVINLKLISNDAEKTPILCNDPVDWATIATPPSVAFDPLFPEKPNDSLYSLFLLNIDYPTPLFPDLSPMILWQVSNIRNCTLEEGETIYEYLPPLPPPNSGPHICVYLLCKQLTGEVDVSKETRVPSTTLIGRSWAGVNFGDYLKERQFEVQSFRFFRIFWSENVRKHYESLGIPEPSYFLRPALLPHKKMKIPGCPPITAQTPAA